MSRLSDYKLFKLDPLSLDKGTISQASLGSGSLNSLGLLFIDLCLMNLGYSRQNF